MAWAQSFFGRRCPHVAVDTCAKTVLSCNGNGQLRLFGVGFRNPLPFSSKNSVLLAHTLGGSRTARVKIVLVKRQGGNSLGLRPGAPTHIGVLRTPENWSKGGLSEVWREGWSFCELRRWPNLAKPVCSILIKPNLATAEHSRRQTSEISRAGSYGFERPAATSAAP